MNKFVLLFVMILFIGCSKQKLETYKEMKSDKLISEFFTDIEIENLAKIVCFFESQICEEVKETNIQKAYKKLLKLDSIRLVDDGELFMMDYKKQKKLYLSLDSVFLKSFFDKGTMDKLIGINPEKRIKYEYLNLKVYGENGLSKYISFLKKFSKENKLLEKYVESAEVSNDFPPLTGQAILIYHYNKHKVNDIKIRLIYSFHHLNINEQNNYYHRL